MKNLENYFRKIFKLKNKLFKKLDENSINFKLNNKELNIIRNHIVRIINNNENKEFKDFKKVYNFLNQTKFYNINKDLNDFITLENDIVRILKKRKLINNFITGIEFPAGVRILHPSTPKQLKGKFQTSSLHCDPWAGEPEDMINIVIYVEVSKKTPLFMLKKTSRININENLKLNNYYKSKMFLNSKKYFEKLSKFSSLSNHKINHKNGEVYLFRGFVPHSTIKQGSKVRVGIELRLRTIKIYENTKRFLSKVNNSGRYWTIPSKNSKNFNERYEDEINYIKINNRKYKKLISLRKLHTKKFLNTNV